jgi:hypothetical protein
MSNQKWLSNWQQKHADVVADGLDSGRTYVVIDRKECPMLDVELRFRPFAERHEDTVVVGGKLAVFPVAGTLKSQPINAEMMAQWLCAAYPNLEFTKKSDTRVGTLVLSGMTVGVGPEAYERYIESDAAGRLFEMFQELLGVDPETPHSIKAKAAIREAFAVQAFPAADTLSEFTGNVIQFKVPTTKH